MGLARKRIQPLYNLTSSYHLLLVNLDGIVGGSFIFTNKQIEALKEVARNGKANLQVRCKNFNLILRIVSFQPMMFCVLTCGKYLPL
jgi:hypothetical protein